MRIEIHPYNEQKVLTAASQLGISTTELVNNIIDCVNINVRMQIDKVNIDFSKVVIEKKKDKKVIHKDGKNWTTDF